MEQAGEGVPHRPSRSGDRHPGAWQLAPNALRSTTGGLLVIDHAEHLDGSGGMDSWIEKKLLRLVADAGVSVLFSVRTPRSERGLRSPRGLPFREVDTLNRTELRTG